MSILITVQKVEFLKCREDEKMHNVYFMNIKFEKITVSEVTFRKSHLKELEKEILGNSMAEGKILDKKELKEVPRMPWFLRPRACYKRELSDA